jgi:hypothetical protein
MDAAQFAFGQSPALYGAYRSGVNAALNGKRREKNPAWVQDREAETKAYNQGYDFVNDCLVGGDDFVPEFN